MKEYYVKRDGKKDLRFFGEQLAEVSSQWVGKEQRDRWTEIEVYRTDKGPYVVSIVRRSRNELEQDSYSAFICPSAREVPEALEQDDPAVGDKFLSRLAKKALSDAAREDPEIEKAMFEEI